MSFKCIFNNNLNIVECRALSTMCPYRQGYNNNLNIVECRVFYRISELVYTLNNNLNIVECRDVTAS